METLLAIVGSTYVMYGLGYAMGLSDEGQPGLFMYLVVALFWPYFKGMADGESE